MFDIKKIYDEEYEKIEKSKEDEYNKVLENNQGLIRYIIKSLISNDDRILNEVIFIEGESYWEGVEVFSILYKHIDIFRKEFNKIGYSIELNAHRITHTFGRHRDEMFIRIYNKDSI